MSNSQIQPIRPLLIVFALVSAFGLTGKNFLIKNVIDPNVLIVGNIVLFANTLIAFLITNKTINSGNPQSFVRAMYLSFMLKFFIVAIAAFIYIMVEKKNVNKPGLIACAALYIIYTVFETSALMNLLKKKKNA
jgi:hypothetical protein